MAPAGPDPDRWAKARRGRPARRPWEMRGCHWPLHVPFRKAEGGGSRTAHTRRRASWKCNVMDATGSPASAPQSSRPHNFLADGRAGRWIPGWSISNPHRAIVTAACRQAVDRVGSSPWRPIPELASPLMLMPVGGVRRRWLAHDTVEEPSTASLLPRGCARHRDRRAA